MDYHRRFGTPRFSGHAFARLRDRGIALADVDAALRTEPVPGSKPGTLWFRGNDAMVVVDAVTRQFITVWRIGRGGR